MGDEMDEAQENRARNTRIAEYAFDELRNDLHVMIEGLEARIVWEGELYAMITDRVFKMRDSSRKGE